jgi:hypothetical protein
MMVADLSLVKGMATRFNQYRTMLSSKYTIRKVTQLAIKKGVMYVRKYATTTF